MSHMAPCENVVRKYDDNAIFGIIYHTNPSSPRKSLMF